MEENHVKNRSEKGKENMTRQEVTDLLIGMGVESPTKEAVDNFLNKYNADVQKEKALAEKYKSDAIKVKELEEQLEKLNNQNLTDLELANINTEKANTRIAELEKQIKAIETKKSLAENGITGEFADKFFTEDGSVDFTNLGQILANIKETAITQKEKELLHGTPNPSGSNIGNNNEKSDIELMAEKAGKEIALMNQTSNDVLANYVK